MKLKELKARLDSGNKLTKEEVNSLSDRDTSSFYNLLNKKSAKLSDDLDSPERVTALDSFWSQTEEIACEHSKSVMWDSNHVRILNYIHNYVKSYWTVPTITNIAQDTGLSRRTIYKHLNETNIQDYLGKEFNKYTLLMPKVLGCLYSLCFHEYSDRRDVIRASKVILDFLQFSTKYGGSVSIREQNNHITINNTTITQDQLQKLSPDKLSEIEMLINEAQETVKLN